MVRQLCSAGRWLRWHLLAAPLLLHGALAAAEAEVLIGGQAVIEGVMMRAPHAYAVAVRRPDGGLATTTAKLARPAERHSYWRWPVLRGLATLGQAMALGVKALRFSGDAALAPEAAAGAGAAATPKKKELSTAGLTVSLIASLAFFVAFYKFLPLLAATGLSHHLAAFRGQLLFNLADGVIRVALFLAFIAGLALLPDIRRVYEYHGAEHKVVFNYESGQPVTVANARRFTRLHPRCGTSFLIVLMLLAIVAYIFIPMDGFWTKLAIRLALLPLLVGLGYEVIRYTAKHGRSLFAVLARPGLWLQRITTQEPSDDQLECSIRALEEAMALEKSQGGELVIA